MTSLTISRCVAGDDSGAAAVPEASNTFDLTPRDAVDCFTELFQLDGILLIPEAPPAGTYCYVQTRSEREYSVFVMIE